jgi:hypothetical protein
MYMLLVYQPLKRFGIILTVRFAYLSLGAVEESRDEPGFEIRELRDFSSPVALQTMEEFSAAR